MMACACSSVEVFESYHDAPRSHVCAAARRQRDPLDDRDRDRRQQAYPASHQARGGALGAYLMECLCVLMLPALHSMRAASSLHSAHRCTLCLLQRACWRHMSCLRAHSTVVRHLVALSAARLQDQVRITVQTQCSGAYPFEFRLPAHVAPTTTLSSTAGRYSSQAF